MLIKIKIEDKKLTKRVENYIVRVYQKSQTLRATNEQLQY